MCDSTNPHIEDSSRNNKSNWMRKLGACSPIKRDFSPSTKSHSRLITPRRTGHRNDDRRRRVPEPSTVLKDSVTNADMLDLEKIIHDFEEGRLSPNKHETRETMKSGHFVKQIVAAFEQKYKAYNNYKIQAEKSSSDSDELMQNEQLTLNSEMEESSFSMGRAYVINNPARRFSHDLDSCETKSVTYTCQSDESINLGMCSFAMDEELTTSTPSKKLSGSSTRLINPKSIILNKAIMPESPKTTKSKLLRSNSSMRRERQPKIVGAFLKKPIEVEDTSIDWIPITGKQLPRKKSFKRLLSILTGKNSSDKSSKLYCSQVNLPEENARELHDSGYDEKSCSSSSLTSLVSITDLLLQQDKYDFEIERKNGTTHYQSDFINKNKTIKNVTFTTFQKSPIDVKQCFEHDDTDDGVLVDDASDTCSVSSKRLLLEEVPRSELRLSLGPSFPFGPRFINKSSDPNDKIYSTISQDVSDYSSEEVSCGTLTLTPPLPRHPFVSSKKKFQDNHDEFETEKDVNFNYFDKVELRRDFQSWAFHSTEATYDVPRRYMSKSEPGLVMIGRNSFSNNVHCDEIVYDVPKPKVPQRPRSSVYEDALSLKRRNANFSYSSPDSGFYAFASQEESHYATVKPRNARICPSRKLMRSVEDVAGHKTSQSQLLR